MLKTQTTKEHECPKCDEIEATKYKIEADVVKSSSVFCIWLKLNIIANVRYEEKIVFVTVAFDSVLAEKDAVAKLH